MRSTRSVCFLVSDGVRMLDVAGPLEVFAQANRSGGSYDVSILSVDGSDVRCSTGFRIAVDGRATDGSRWDIAIVGGRESFSRTAVPEPLVTAAHHLHDRSHRIAAICSGAFVLGAAGILDGKRSTAHRQHLDALARRFPRTRVVADQLYVGDHGTYTSGGVGSAIDLSIALVGDDDGNRLARSVARSVDLYHQLTDQQDPVTGTGSEPERASALRSVIDRVRADPTAGYSTERLAQIGRVSPRHLTRLFQNELGTTPMRYVEDVRFERARSYLLEGHAVTRAAELSGFGCSETMRRAFANRLRISPQQYQRQHGTLPSAPAGPGPRTG